jgi:hypothetical protein
VNIQKTTAKVNNHEDTMMRITFDNETINCRSNDDQQSTIVYDKTINNETNVKIQW